MKLLERLCKRLNFKFIFVLVMLLMIMIPYSFNNRMISEECYENGLLTLRNSLYKATEKFREKGDDITAEEIREIAEEIEIACWLHLRNMEEISLNDRRFRKWDVPNLSEWVRELNFLDDFNKDELLIIRDQIIEAGPLLEELDNRLGKVRANGISYDYATDPSNGLSQLEKIEEVCAGYMEEYNRISAKHPKEQEVDEDMLWILEDKVSSSKGLDELLNAFQETCEVPVESDEELFWLEPGYWDGGEQILSFVRQYDTPDPTNDEFMQLRMDVKLTPVKLGFRERRRIRKSGELEEKSAKALMKAFRNSDLYRYVKENNLEILGVECDLDET